MNDPYFINFITNMFNENCLERSQYGEKEYPNVETYYNKNKEFLKQKYKKQGEK